MVCCGDIGYICDGSGEVGYGGVTMLLGEFGMVGAFGRYPASLVIERGKKIYGAVHHVREKLFSFKR